MNWLDLPNEVQTYILLFIPLNVLVHKCRLISHKIKSQADGDTIWKTLVQQISGDTRLPKGFSSWKELYISYYSDFSWAENSKGKNIKLIQNNRKAISLNEGGWTGNRVSDFFWQMVLSKISITPTLNYAEFIIDEFDSSLVNTRGIMIGIDCSSKSKHNGDTPAWIGLETGWGYAAKSGEMFVPGSRVNHANHPFSTPYEEGDEIGVLVDFKKHRLAFFVNKKLRGIEVIPSGEWKDDFCFAMAAAHGRTSVTIRPPQHREHCLRIYEESAKSETEPMI